MMNEGIVTLSGQVKLLMGRPIRMAFGFITCRRLRLVELNVFAMTMSMSMTKTRVSQYYLSFFSI